MSEIDLKNRLRLGTAHLNHSALIELCAQAADEIERLREGRDTMGNLWAKAKDEIERLRRDKGHHPSGLLKASDVVDWAVSRWQAEVANRPLQNQSRRPLDDTWRQIIRQYGGDDVARCGPTHDDLLNNRV